MTQEGDGRRTEPWGQDLGGTVPRANTPWGLWSAAEKEKKDLNVWQGSLSATMDDIRRHRLNEHMRGKQTEDFGRKAWMQCDRNSSAWITACPKEHSSLNNKQFPVVCQTYFGVPQACLEGLKGQPILQKLVKATLPSGGWTYHHNGINL